jgi:hypothetical protein
MPMLAATLLAGMAVAQLVLTLGRDTFGTAGTGSPSMASSQGLHRAMHG